MGTAFSRAPLLQLARYANDATRLSSLAALELLALNLPDAADKVDALGGDSLRRGLIQHGNAPLREMVSSEGALEKPAKRVAVDAKTHAKQAKKARLRHSRLGAGRSRLGVQRAHLPPGADGESGAELHSVFPYSMVGTAPSSV